MELRDSLIILYDYYGELLSEDNRQYFEDYYFDNLSLGEIAENNGVSRNAIHKHIKSVEEKLLFYEEKLELYKRDKKIKDKLNSVNNDENKKIIENFLSQI